MAAPTNFEIRANEDENVVEMTCIELNSEIENMLHPTAEWVALPSSEMAEPASFETRANGDQNLSAAEMPTLKVILTNKNNFFPSLKIPLNDPENQYLLDLYSEHHETLDSRSRDAPSAEKRRQIWEQITVKFNAAAQTPRSSTQLKKWVENHKAKIAKEEPKQLTPPIKRTRSSYRQAELNNSTSPVKEVKYAEPEENEDEEEEGDDQAANATEGAMLTGYCLTSFDDEDPSPTGDDTAVSVGSHSVYRVRLGTPEPRSRRASLRRGGNRALPSAGSQPKMPVVSVTNPRLQDLETKERQLKVKLAQRQLELLDEDASRKQETHDAKLQLIRAQSDYWTSIRGIPPSLTT